MPDRRRRGSLATTDAATLVGRGVGLAAVRFAPQVVLSKDEVFGACQALADAGRVLVRSGGSREADVLCSLFSLLEARLVTDAPLPALSHAVNGSGAAAQSSAGSNSNDSELTQ